MLYEGENTMLFPAVILLIIYLIVKTLLSDQFDSSSNAPMIIGIIVVTFIVIGLWSCYSGSVVKTQIQSFYNELIYIVDKGEGYFPTRLHNQSTVLDSRRTLEFGC